MNILEKMKADIDDLGKPFAGMLDIETRQLVDESIEADVADLN
jgi:hypothetical protein